MRALLLALMPISRETYSPKYVPYIFLSEALEGLYRSRILHHTKRRETLRISVS